jgi:hypothetical protein
MLQHTLSEIKKSNLQFELIREKVGDAVESTFALIIPQVPQHKMTTRRFRHHGPRKYIASLEIVPGSEVKRVEISRARAERIARKAHRDGRVVCISGDESRGSIRIKAVGTSAQRPTYELAAQGTTVRPDWVNRYLQQLDGYHVNGRAGSLLPKEETGPTAEQAIAAANAAYAVYARLIPAGFGAAANPAAVIAYSQARAALREVAI